VNRKWLLSRVPGWLFCQWYADQSDTIHESVILSNGWHRRSGNGTLTLSKCPRSHSQPESNPGYLVAGTADRWSPASWMTAVQPFCKHDEPGHCLDHDETWRYWTNGLPKMLSQYRVRVIQKPFIFTTGSIKITSVGPRDEIPMDTINGICWTLHRRQSVHTENKLYNAYDRKYYILFIWFVDG